MAAPWSQSHLKCPHPVHHRPPAAHPQHHRPQAAHPQHHSPQAAQPQQLHGPQAAQPQHVHSPQASQPRQQERLPRRKHKSWEFKHFTVAQDLCAQKVGTDSMLLGSWAQPGPDAAHIMDIGCGTGVLGLMLAQKAPHSHIHAIDIDEAACQQAAVNASASPWGERVQVFHTSLEQLLVWQEDQYSASSSSSSSSQVTANTLSSHPGPHPLSSWRRPPGGYQCIISNPPFYVNSYVHPTLQPSSQAGGSDTRDDTSHSTAQTVDPATIAPAIALKRAVARHAGAAGVGLTFEALAAGAHDLLADGGALFVVLPVLNNEATIFCDLATKAGLQLVQVLQVYTLPPPQQEKRRLMKFVKSAHPQDCKEEMLVVNLGTQEKLALGLDPGLTVPAQQYLQLTADYHHEAFQARWWPLYERG